MNEYKTPRNNDDVAEDPSHLGYSVKDKGDRRSGIDRRHFTYLSYIPERRRVQERRNPIHPPPQEAA
jgi:hypothetical protein